MLNCFNGLKNYIKQVNETIFWLLTLKSIEMQKWDRFLLQNKLLASIKLACVLNNCLFKKIQSRCSIKLIYTFQKDDMKFARHQRVWNSRCRWQTWKHIHNILFFYLFICCIKKRISINGSTQKHQNIWFLINPVKLWSYLLLKQKPLHSHQHLIYRHSDTTRCQQ